jgi:hypothetical protein
MWDAYKLWIDKDLKRDEHDLFHDNVSVRTEETKHKSSQWAQPIARLRIEVGTSQ